MGLYARIEPNAINKISVHRFGAALREWATAGLTRQQVIDAFALTGSEVTELDALRAAYVALGTSSGSQFARAEFMARMEDVFILCETGDYTEAKAKARLGF